MHMPESSGESVWAVSTYFNPMRYRRRLAEFSFDPYLDIACEACGCWRWNTDKPVLHAYVRNYFASRNEDGTRGRVNPALEESRA